MREQPQKGGSHYLKWKEIEKKVYEEFIECKQKRLVIHDRDLKESALLAADELGLTDFKVYNTDQTGINLEMHTGRTLEFQGEKTVEAVVQKTNATTHSYTIQPVISADGKLQSPMLVCFYEPVGAPKKFEDELKAFTNLKCVSSKSGLLTSNLETDWFYEVFLPNIEDDSLLLVDSWNGYKQSLADEKVQEKLEIKVIPPKTTGEIQPLDVFFNRQFKIFVRQLSDKIRRRHNDTFVLSNRANIAKMISLIHYQFSAPLFEAFIRYAWYASGYLDQRPADFETPPQYCLDDYRFDSRCSYENCNSPVFIRCAYYQNIVCFDHCIVEQHRCHVI